MSTGIDDQDRPWAAKVEALAGYGLTAADLACVLAMDEDVLKATYAHELESSHLKANARVAESLYRKALGDGRESVTAAIFWLKTRARWKETSVHEVTIDPKAVDLTSWSDEQLEAEIKRLDAVISDARGAALVV
jgi:hypothetical protein